MIQDIYPHVLDNQYKIENEVDDNGLVISIYDEKIAILNDQLFIKACDIKDKSKLRYIFSIDGNKYYLLSEKVDIEGCDYLNYRDIRNQHKWEKLQMFAVMTAKHIFDWYRDTKFCGRCGKPMMHSKTERAMHCDCCNYTAYPRIMPAVIVGVIDGDRIVLTKYKTGFAHNALVAGFTEIGETCEETVQREVMEEVGLKVKNIRYYKSQPWGIANDILLGFYCDVDGDTTIRMDDNELKYAEFVKREDIILQPDDFSLTNEMMMMFKEGKIS